VGDLDRDDDLSLPLDDLSGELKLKLSLGCPGDNDFANSLCRQRSFISLFILRSWEELTTGDDEEDE